MKRGMKPMSSKHLYAVIIGCGRLGSHIANLLSGNGHSIVIIDRKEDSFKSLSSEFGGFKIVGDATENEVLEKARISKADVVVSVTDDDSTNIMIAQIAKKVYKVPKVLARVFEPARGAVYQKLGIDTLCPTTLSAMEFKKKILDDSQLMH